MLDRLVVPLALMTLLMATAACGATARNASTESAGALRATPFEAWAVSNGTGAFFKAVGPAGGTGVRSGWPE